jgi:hypothetical protein
VSAPVTREHRELAYILVEEAGYETCSPDGKAYIDGLPVEGEYSWENQVAQAIADAEARGEARALRVVAPALAAGVLAPGPLVK